MRCDEKTTHEMHVELQNMFRRLFRRLLIMALREFVSTRSETNSQKGMLLCHIIA